MTATETPNVERPFSTSEQPDDEYRPLSQLAIVCLVVSVLSPLALVIPVLWIIPLVAIVLAALSLRAIAASEGELRGRGLAATALALALLFLSWAVAGEVSTNVVLARQSRQHAETWWQLIHEGRTYEAHQLTLGHSVRLPADVSLEEMYEGETETETASQHDHSEGFEAMDMFVPEMHNPGQLQTAYREFMDSPAMENLDQVHSSLRVQYERSLGRAYPGLHEVGIRHLFTVFFEENGQRRSRQVELTLIRNRQNSQAFWHVNQVELWTGSS
jgi:hypothetical protein